MAPHATAPCPPGPFPTEQQQQHPPRRTHIPRWVWTCCSFALPPAGSWPWCPLRWRSGRPVWTPQACPSSSQTWPLGQGASSRSALWAWDLAPCSNNSSITSSNSSSSTSTGPAGADAPAAAVRPGSCSRPLSQRLGDGHPAWGHVGRCGCRGGSSSGCSSGCCRCSCCTHPWRDAQPEGRTGTPCLPRAGSGSAWCPPAPDAAEPAPCPPHWVR